VLLGLFPWTSLLFKSLFQRYSKKPRELFFFLWFLVPFIFFSISHSKLIPYILPVFPALAVLMARRIGEGASFKAEILTHSLFSMVLGVAVMVVIGDVDPDLKMILKTHLVALSGVLGGSAILVPILFWKYGGTIKAFGGILITGIVVVFIVIMAAPLVPRLSIKPLANIFLDKMPKDTDVFTYITYYQDLPPYLGRTVTVVEWQGELAFGMNDDPAQTQIVTHEMFEQAWRTKPRVCVFTRQNRYENLATYSWFTHTVLGRHDGQVLACRNDFEQIRHQD
jgi:4-amino-4-deoxy-L-arabinose transferase-like glycosyltransferase